MVKDMDSSLFSEKTLDINNGDESNLLITKNTIIELWVTWCPHCKAMMPRYEDASSKLKDTDCYRIEMEQNPGIADIFQVESFPTFVFLTPDGNAQKWVGEVSEEDFINIAKKEFNK